MHIKDTLHILLNNTGMFAVSASPAASVNGPDPMSVSLIVLGGDASKMQHRETPGHALYMAQKHETGPLLLCQLSGITRLRVKGALAGYMADGMARNGDSGASAPA
ncbi:uncharacterized protein LAESUDRAFT_462312 [Laetiporus sulphureus 93-53]|uniref:Uncharacterized protein n=1 Tax=Laetiporus sulphureus 93-53 TaxID=1314785 RepID=A0A165G581_9APHY|nr:uncharacterized protein LAESUDRAFT_462312 [Laetiporus sulphureus 93-53]KZT09846.1 hypothetical protein LAESUDRAFT_462312 [Laetiporus sulphureus 93-53]